MAKDIIEQPEPHIREIVCICRLLEAEGKLRLFTIIWTFFYFYCKTYSSILSGYFLIVIPRCTRILVETGLVSRSGFVAGIRLAFVFLFLSSLYFSVQLLRPSIF